MELLRFVPDIAADEQRKIMRFEKGLTLDLLAKAGGDTYATLEFIYGKVAFIYGVQQRKREYQTAMKRKEPPSHHSSRPTDFKRPNQGGDFTQFHQQRVAQQNYSTRVHRCRGCSKNHPGTDYNGRPVQCKNCGGMGHRSYECTA